MEERNLYGIICSLRAGFVSVRRNNGKSCAALRRRVAFPWGSLLNNAATVVASYDAIVSTEGLMIKPAVGARSKFRHQRHLQVSHEADSQSEEQPSLKLVKERARSCIVQDRLLSALQTNCRPETELLGDIDTDNSEEASAASDSEQAANAELSDRMMLLKIVGLEATAIKNGLELCRRISAALGKEAPSLQSKLRMDFQV